MVELRRLVHTALPSSIQVVIIVSLQFLEELSSLSEIQMAFLLDSPANSVIDLVIQVILKIPPEHLNCRSLLEKSIGLLLKQLVDHVLLRRVDDDRTRSILSKSLYLMKLSHT